MYEETDTMKKEDQVEDITSQEIVSNERETM